MVKTKTILLIGRHEHCDACYDAFCRAPDQTSVSCMVISCARNCGAVLHKCKQEEHQLLCPNESVACLNANYGCPLTLQRHRLAKHLEACPASVVCCSQEWNRWPVSEADLTFCRNISGDPRMEPHLDVALALRDQELLFRSIKMKKVFPELIIEEDVAPLIANANSGVSAPAEEVAACSSDSVELAENSLDSRTEATALGQEETISAQTTDVDRFQRFGSWDKLFAKEKGGCQETVKNMQKKEEEERRSCQDESQDKVFAASTLDGATGLAPWQDGVLERLGKEFNIGEYNMYLAHNGTMLINFGQLPACTPREKDFVYGNLEPIEVKSVRTFNVPTSYRSKRAHSKDPSRTIKTVHRGTDTADLGTLLDKLPECDEVAATLLCSLEMELRGHAISETKGIDGLYVDVGTQTYNFRSAPFEADASLADVLAADKPPGLCVHVETEPVSRRHNKTNSAFTYTCGRFFRRDEFRSHFRNVHCDIQASLGGWLQQRCPLAYLGCTFAQTRLHPTGQRIRFHRDVNALSVRPHGPSDGKTSSCGRDPDPLSRLPLEILQHMAGYLDAVTLSQLSRVSRQMRELCTALLQEQGMVSLCWEKKTYSHGGSSWRCRKKVWEFSSAFSSVDTWSFSGAATASMSDHLKTCTFYQRVERTEPVVLAFLGEVRDKRGAPKEKR